MSTPIAPELLGHVADPIDLGIPVETLEDRMQHIANELAAPMGVARDVLEGGPATARALANNHARLYPHGAPYSSPSSRSSS